MFGNVLSPWHLIFILLIALICFGPGKLPEVAKGLGNAVNEFKKASNGVQQEFMTALKNDGVPEKVAAAPLNEPEVKPRGAQVQE